MNIQTLQLIGHDGQDAVSRTKQVFDIGGLFLR